jgi:hypothetical protein
MLLTILGVLTAVWVSSLSLFFFLIKRKYVVTFVSLESGSSYVALKFMGENGVHPSDEIRATIFGTNVVKWRGIRQPVKDWFQDNYELWRLSPPIWFDSAFLAKVPADFIPTVDVSNHAVISPIPAALIAFERAEPPALE